MGKFDICRLFTKKVPTVPLQEFNKAGNRILSKQLLPLNSKALKGIDIPADAGNAERLIVEKQFGKQSVEIISFKDKDGYLISRMRRNYTGQELTGYAQSRYGNGKGFSDNYRIQSGDKQVQYFTPDGYLQSMDRIKTDIVKCNNEPGKHVSRMRYNSTKNADGNFDGQFSVYHKYANQITNEINMDVTHSANGELLNRHFGRIQNVSDKLLNDPYLVARAMSDEFAVRNISDRFLRIYNPSDKNLNICFNRGKPTLYENGHFERDVNTMYISLEPELSYNTYTTSHELRHKKQFEYADMFWKQLWYKLTNSPKYNKRIFKLASHFKWQTVKYDSPFIHYKTNGLETDAHRKGLRYVIDYNRRTNEFKKHFPYTSNYTRGVIEI